MSSKGRKQVEEAEFYPTPRWCIESLLESPLVQLPGGLWIEPCAGTGRIISAVNSCRDDVNWIVCELQEQFKPYLKPLIRPGRDTLCGFGDFVHRPWSRPWANVLIMNPPFSLTHQFVKAAFRRAGWVVCLQRQGWFGTKERSPWLAQHCPDLHQLPERPSFRPDGSTDSCEYCWFVWPPPIDGSRERGRGYISMLSMPGAGQQSFGF